MSLVIPSHVAVGALGFNAEVDPDLEPEGIFSSAKSGDQLIEPTSVPGTNNGRGSRIAFRNSDEGQRPGASTALTHTAEPQDNATHGCTPPRLIAPMSTVSIAAHEQEREKEGKFTSSVVGTGFSHNPPFVEQESEVESQRQERENKGIVTRRPTASLAERISEDDHLQVGDNAHGTVQSGKPEGECQ